VKGLGLCRRLFRFRDFATEMPTQMFAVTYTRGWQTNAEECAGDKGSVGKTGHYE
jgi:hypothetical protein